MPRTYLGLTAQPVYGLPYAKSPGGIYFPVAMTSDTTPAGWEASASSEYNSAAGAWNVFNEPRATGGAWLTAAGATGWVKIALPYPVVATGYTMYPWWSDNFPARSPTAWTLEGSNDGLTWVLLDTRTGISWASATTLLTYSLSIQVACTSFRLIITANGGNGYLGLGSFRIIGRRF